MQISTAAHLSKFSLNASNLCTFLACFSPLFCYYLRDEKKEKPSIWTAKLWCHKTSYIEEENVSLLEQNHHSLNLKRFQIAKRKLTMELPFVISRHHRKEIYLFMRL